MFFYPCPVFLYVWMPLIGEFSPTFGNTKLSFLSSMACGVLVGTVSVTCPSSCSRAQWIWTCKVRLLCLGVLGGCCYLLVLCTSLLTCGDDLTCWVAQTLPCRVLGPNSWCTDVISTSMRKFTVASPSQPKCLLTYPFASVLEGEEFFIFSTVWFPVPPPSRRGTFNWSPSFCTISNLSAASSPVHKGSDLTHSLPPSPQNPSIWFLWLFWLATHFCTSA